MAVLPAASGVPPTLYDLIRPCFGPMLIYFGDKIDQRAIKTE